MGLSNIVLAINRCARPLNKQGGVGQHGGFGYTVSGLCFGLKRFRSQQGSSYSASRKSLFMFKPGQRIVLKLSGEFLQGTQTHGLCWDTLDRLCHMVVALPQYQWVVVVGGGNFFRGKQGAEYCGQGVADTMGMMATHFNGLALCARLQALGTCVSIMTARTVDGVGEPFQVMNADRLLHAGGIVVCTGGLGHGAMTTDTTAVVRACELDASCVIKGTSVNGVYSHDPKTCPDAVFYPTISWDQAIIQRLGVVDMTALVLAKSYEKPIIVFSLNHEAGLKGVLEQSIPYSIIHHSIGA
jgi:uridylate kinase